MVLAINLLYYWFCLVFVLLALFIVCDLWFFICVIVINFLTDAEFRNTGLERSEALAKDLEWFKEQGYAIPEPSAPGVTYSEYLKELSEKDPQAFICHFYNVYFAHSAGGRMIGRKVTNIDWNYVEIVLIVDILHLNGWTGCACVYAYVIQHLSDFLLQNSCQWTWLLALCFFFNH